MRLEAQSKGGYYPVSPQTIREAFAVVRVAGKKLRILDPCCGKGDALLEIARNTGAAPADLYGCEIETGRVRDSRAALVPEQIVEGDALSLRMNRCFNVIWINPPFDKYNGGRYEWSFLSYMIRHAACREAVLLWHVPEGTISQYRYQTYLEKHFADHVLFAPSHRPFREMVFVGRLKRRDSDPYVRVSGGVEVPPLPPGKVVFGISGVSPGRILDLAAASPLMRLFYGKPSRTGHRPNPPMQLKRQHLAMLLSSGILDGVLEDGKNRMLIKATCNKELVLVDERQDEDSGQSVSVYRERPKTLVRVLHENGRIDTLS